MSARKETAPFALQRVRGPENLVTKALLQWRDWLGKLFRRFLLRTLARNYAKAVHRTWDRMASRKLDCVTFLLEAEDAGDEQ